MLIRYRRADCTRFRTPPIDTGAVQRKIEQSFLEAWQNGLSARDAYRQVLNDADITAALTSQVAPHLAFQRAVEVRSISADVEAARTAYEHERRETLSAVQSTLGQEAETVRQQYQGIQQVKTERAAGYTATAARLEELRKRVSDQIAAIGGTEGYRALLEIHGVTSDASPESVTPLSHPSVPKPVDAIPPYRAPPQEPLSAPRVPSKPTPIPSSPASLEQRVAETPTIPAPPAMKTERMAKRRTFLQYLKSLFFR